MWRLVAPTREFGWAGVKLPTSDDRQNFDPCVTLREKTLPFFIISLFFSDLLIFQSFIVNKLRGSGLLRYVVICLAEKWSFI